MAGQVPAERASAGPFRPVAGAWRSLIGPFLALTLLSTLTLYVGATETDRFFAWTVQPAMSAAFLGGGYAAGFLLIVLTARQHVWAHARRPAAFPTTCAKGPRLQRATPRPITPL